MVPVIEDSKDGVATYRAKLGFSLHQADDWRAYARRERTELPEVLTRSSEVYGNV